jgi:hypothetical protein
MACARCLKERARVKAKAGEAFRAVARRLPGRKSPVSRVSTVTLPKK